MSSKVAMMYLKQQISSSKDNRLKTGSKTNGVVHSASKEKRRASISFNRILSITCLVAIGSLVYWATSSSKK